MIDMAREAGMTGLESGGLFDNFLVFEELVRADEREACAKVCEQPIDEIQITDTISEVVYMDAHECAAGIRARGRNAA